MRIFLQKQHQTRKLVPGSLASSNTAAPGLHHHADPILHSQRGISDQAALRTLQTRAEEPGIGLTITAPSRSGHDFSRIPIHPPPAPTIQTKLAINAPGDEYEQEADRGSERVVRMPDLQRQAACACGGECPKCQTAQPGQKQKYLQTNRVGWDNVGPSGAPPIVQEVLGSPGQPLDPAARAYMEPKFGFDFSQVRIHTDATAAHSARAVNALAYTMGADVVFAGGQYAPGTAMGRHLLAHELTHVVQQSGVQETTLAPHARGMSRPTSSPMLLQRQKGAVDIDKLPWKDAVDLAEKDAKDAKTKSAAEDIYKKLVVRAAQNVTVSAPLVDRKPSVSDIIWDWKGTADYSAFVDPKKIDKAPDDYWKWITFKPASIQKDEAFTVSVIFHEMDHAIHGKALYDEYKKASPKPKLGWEDFYLEHFNKWTEPAIKVKDSGVAGALAGLPAKVQPSGIEFRAYVSQFVNFFHKVGLNEQSYMARSVVLFYPLKQQSPNEKIADPMMDVAKSRQLLLDYFKKPPVDTAKIANIQTRVAAEFKSALVLSRPDADQGQIKKDFKEIVDFEADADARKEARKAYKPEPL